jgi:hypothetical protein
MRTRPLMLAAGVVMATVALGAPPAKSADLTGIWIGEQKCDRFNGKKFHTTFPNDIMVISQSGDQTNMAALCSLDSSQTQLSCNLFFQGLVIDDAKEPDKQAQTTFTACGTTPTSDYQETGRATKVELKKKGDGKFEATSIFLQVQDTPPPPTDTGTCEWNYKRVSTVDIGVEPCADTAAPTATLQSQGVRGPRRP